jgi:hypothetical protein
MSGAKACNVSFKRSAEEAQLISAIVQRARLSGSQRGLNLSMDLAATHANGCPLDLERLLKAPRFDFWHDLYGITEHLDRTTGRLLHCFVPRCAKREGRA